MAPRINGGRATDLSLLPKLADPSVPELYLDLYGLVTDEHPHPHTYTHLFDRLRCYGVVIMFGHKRNVRLGDRVTGCQSFSTLS